jgi:DNA repair protein RadD
MITLRPYQAKAIDDSAKAIAGGSKKVLLIAPTASGKSIIIGGIADRATKRKPGTRILVLCSSSHILSQNEAKIKLIAPRLKTGIYCAGLGRKDTNADVILASRDSLGRNPTAAGEFAGIIVDEAHQVAVDLEDSKTMYARILNAQGYKWCLGLTGTPWRLSGGRIWGKDKFFEKIACNISMETLRKEGFLVPYSFPNIVTKIDTSKVERSSTGDFAINQLDKVASAEDTIRACIAEWFNYGGIMRKVTLFFCVTRAHAKKTAELVKEMYGIDCGYIDGEVTGSTRVSLLDQIRDSQFRCFCSVGVLTTGFDAPVVDCICLLRPTLSASLFVQMCGRGLRPYRDKTDLLILDMAGNFDRFGSLETPMVNTPPPPIGDGTGNGGREITYMECPSCKAIIPSFAKSCRYCLEVLRTEKEEVFTKLKWYAVLHIEIMDYTTAKGEAAKRITYYINGSQLRLHEYFLVNRGGWFRRVYQKRLDQLSGTCIRAVRGEVEGKLFKLADVEYMEGKESNVRFRESESLPWDTRQRGMNILMGGD